MQEAVQIMHHFKELMASFSPAIVQMVISSVIILIYIVLSRRIAPFVYRTIAASVLKDEMNRRALVVFHILLFLLLVVVLSVVWGIDIKGLLVLASSMIAVIGVALFAAWSLLSNITAFFIMLGQRNFAPGVDVRILDGANHVEGKVMEINLFSTVLLTKNNEQIVYPNNLIVSRPVIVQQHQLKVDKNKIVNRWRRRQPDPR
ncbi:mechanosensitive ion channel family protein [Rheinheimera sediminis]|uniref:mechanosensitive ion channel family protein n=1 Tax=Rheinheimera sp. YQF-1 TaxID=2499626 RepID=UPI0021BDDBE8|nr:mechanosensitive ion channel family protein [Rheinheimera sp. YQF-1]